MPARALDHGTVMERIPDGHRDSTDVLFKRYWSPLVACAFGIVSDRDTAEDVVQMTFLRLRMKSGHWAPEGTPSSYLFRTTRNLALNACRDERLRQRRHQEGGGNAAEALLLRTPAEDLETRRLHAEIERAIQRLSERRREVFVLSRLHDLTHREIAERLGTSSQTVSNHMSAALGELRHKLAYLSVRN